VNLPGIIGERLFAISDHNHDGALTLTEFASTILKINSSDPKIKMQLIFDIYDFDMDGKANISDIITVLLHTFPNVSKDITKDHINIFKEENKAV